MKNYPDGYVIDMEAFRKKFKIGDKVKVPGVIAGLTHSEYRAQPAEVVGLYKRFFNVRYTEGFEQSIPYQDAGMVVRRWNV